jgi:hypothetical protein
VRRPIGGAQRTSAPAATGLAVLATLAVALVASVPGSVFHPLLPAGSGAGPLEAVASALRLDLLSPAGRVAAGVAAMGAAVVAFLLALRAAWAGRISVRTALWLGLGFHALAVALPLLLSRDVYSYAAYGRILAVHGENPYLVAPGDFPADPVLPLVGPQWTGTPAVYGPLFTLISAAVAGLSDDPGVLSFAFKALAGLASAATMLLVARVAARTRPDRTALAVVLIGWNPAVLFHVVGGGHNDALVGLSVAAALALLLSGRELGATVALALGALVKAVVHEVRMAPGGAAEGQRHRDGHDQEQISRSQLGLLD